MSAPPPPPPPPPPFAGGGMYAAAYQENRPAAEGAAWGATGGAPTGGYPQPQVAPQAALPPLPPMPPMPLNQVPAYYPASPAYAQPASPPHEGNQYQPHQATTFPPAPAPSYYDAATAPGQNAAHAGASPSQQLPQGGTGQQPPQTPPGGRGQNNASPDGQPTRQQSSTAANPNSSFGSNSGTAAAPNAAARRARPRPPGANRIDSSQVPSPCRDLQLEQPGQPRLRFTTSKGTPPLTVTNFAVIDDGNASPKFVRPTLHSAPYEDGFLRDSGLPWGAVIQPLFDVPEEERPPVIAGRPPVRCHRCRAYINPHVKFVELGRQWQCNFCDMSNEVPADYFSNLDQNGRRRDADQRLEFSRGSVDHDVDGIADYALKGEKGEVPTRPLHHLFAFDVSKAARESLPDVVESARATLRVMAVRYPMCSVSFITYASTLHFYNFSHPAMPQMTVADVDHPFVPLPFTLLCWMNVDEDAEKIEGFLDRLPQLADVVNETESAVGAVVKVAQLILASTGGKVIMTVSKLPSVGLGVIKPRNVTKLYGTEQEKDLLKPVDGFWPTTAIECAKSQISFDLMVFPTDFCELVTLGQLCHLTNGIQSCFINYSPAADSLRLKLAFEQSLLQTSGYGALLRVRCSPGIRIKQYHGHFLSQDPHDMDLAAVHSSSTFLAELVHESKIDAKASAYIQAALLYTTRCGHRRVRVHTVKMTVCNTYAVLFRNADLEANLVACIHKSIHDAVNKGTKHGRDQSNQRIIDMLVAYRKYCSSGSHSGQLLLPEQLKLLPLYNLALCKSDALVGGTDVRIDERVQSIFNLMTMPMHRVLFYLYPRLYSLRNILSSSHAGLLHPVNSTVFLPPLSQLTTDVVMTHGVYALHDQQANTVYLWIGSQVSPNVSLQLFGTDDPLDIGVGTGFDKWHERMRNILISLTKGNGESIGQDRLVVLHEKKDPAEEAFFRNMLEDEAVPGGQSYSDLLCAFHKAINARLM